MDIAGTFTPFKDVSPAELRTWIRERTEGKFTLLDVRQPGEYEAGHVPGALLLPLPELPDRLAEVDHTRPAVVYCRSGNRSRSAAALLAGDGVEAFNLAGGMLAWNGHTATGAAEAGLELIKDRTSPEQLVALAWALEEGAGQFYRAIADKASGENERRMFLSLAAAEEGHKGHVLAAWRSLTGQEQVPDPVKQGISGVMEGGLPIKETLDFLRSRDSREVLEVAMQIEANSLDLYLKIIRWTSLPAVKDIFSQLVAEEKKHLEGLGRLLEGA
jgi:sulfur-carrier protein adenylyltransferase/sulfurtransferase